MKNRFAQSLLLLLITLVFNPLFSQNAVDTYYQEGDLVYEDHIYKAGIRTVRLYPIGSELSMPIIKLGGGGRLLLEFDDLYEDYVDYSYRIVHCDANWQPSALMPAQYLSNFQDFIINQFEYSTNALLPYTNYQLTIPNDQVQLTKSGNYLLVVYANGDKDDLVLSRRFMIYEDFVSAGGVVKRSSLVDNFDTHQEIDFTLNHPNYTIQNPFQDLQVVLMQNQRWDNAIRNLKPLFVQNNQLTYNYDRENNFSGINEFRFFDIKNLLTLTQNIRRVNRDSVYTVYMKTDLPKTIEPYEVWPDINGNYTIRRLDAGNSSSEADYAYVDFILDYPNPVETGDVYLFGKFTDWKLLPEYKLTYDYVRSAYRVKALMKQGFYNYSYALSKDGKYSADLSLMEGDHWETENDYQLLIYNREVGIRYDRLVGFGTLTSQDLY
jgi:hypothetical protein